MRMFSAEEGIIKSIFGAWHCSISRVKAGAPWAETDRRVRRNGVKAGCWAEPEQQRGAGAREPNAGARSERGSPDGARGLGWWITAFGLRKLLGFLRRVDWIVAGGLPDCFLFFYFSFCFNQIN